MRRWMMAGGAAVLIAGGSARAVERVDAAAAPVDLRIADDVKHTLDKDGKACVTREDFVKFQQSVFEKIDKNGDGKLVAPEFTDAG